jgi:hypothetical protein
MALSSGASTTSTTSPDLDVSLFWLMINAGTGQLDDRKRLLYNRNGPLDDGKRRIATDDGAEKRAWPVATPSGGQTAGGGLLLQGRFRRVATGFTG